MPYIKQEDRIGIDAELKNLSEQLHNAGQFNYAFTSLIHMYLENNGLNYERLNAMIGMLECAKMELYRRVTSIYEDLKLKQNGDVTILSFLKDLHDQK